MLKNIRIVQKKYKYVIGILYNGYEAEVYKGIQKADTQGELKAKEYYLGFFAINKIDKSLIYSLTRSINDTLHFNFVIKNLYHRMIFTACALVANIYSRDIGGFILCRSHKEYKTADALGCFL